MKWLLRIFIVLEVKPAKLEEIFIVTLQQKVNQTQRVTSLLLEPDYMEKANSPQLEHSVSKKKNKKKRIKHHREKKFQSKIKKKLRAK